MRNFVGTGKDQWDPKCIHDDDDDDDGGGGGGETTIMYFSYTTILWSEENY